MTRRMTPQEIDAQAKANYDACWVVKPKWEQLGDVTRSVWRERVQPPQPVAPVVKPGHQDSLF